MQKSMNKDVKKQIMTIRKSGLTSMFDVPKLKEIADDLGFVALLRYLSNHKRQYVQYILTGEVAGE